MKKVFKYVFQNWLLFQVWWQKTKAIQVFIHFGYVCNFLINISLTIFLLQEARGSKSQTLELK